jgi:hypothetical protein
MFRAGSTASVGQIPNIHKNVGYAAPLMNYAIIGRMLSCRRAINEASARILNGELKASK